MEIGPSLPPHLAKNLTPDVKRSGNVNEENENDERSQLTQAEGNDSDDSDSYGPALPPGFQRRDESVSRTRVIGPMRPPQFEHPRADTSSGLYELSVKGNLQAAQSFIKAYKIYQYHPASGLMQILLIGYATRGLLVIVLE